MININYNGKTEITITGHAGSGPAGHDLVCASVTALALTLAENVEQMKLQGAVSEAHLDLCEGKANITCTPAEDMEHIVELIYQAIYIGFRGLAEANPEHIVFGVEPEK